MFVRQNDRVVETGVQRPGRRFVLGAKTLASFGAADEVAAENRTLSFMLGGVQSDIDDAIPLLALMGRHFHHMGPFGSGMQAKVLNNLLAASHTAMTRLVLDWADAAGLDTDRLLALIETSSGQNWLASGFETIEFSKDGYASDNSIGILVKDVAAALDAAADGADTALPQTVQATIRALTPRSQDRHRTPR